MIVISIINMDNSNIQVSVETPDLLRLQTNAIEQATGAKLPFSIHYGINSNNEKQVQGTIGFPGLPGSARARPCHVRRLVVERSEAPGTSPASPIGISFCSRSC